MYTRSRQNNQGFGSGGQRQGGNQNPSGNFQNQQQGPNQNSFSQQGNYQSSQSSPASQQGNYKPGNAQQFKSQQPTVLQQQANQQRMQQQQTKNNQQLQQQQLQQQLKQQQHQQQQTGPGTPQAQRLKPILKQSPVTPAPVSQPSPQTPQTPQTPQNQPIQQNQQSQQTPQTPQNQQNQQTPQNQQNQQVQPQAQTPQNQIPQNQPQQQLPISESKTENAENTEAMELSEQQPRWKRKNPGFKVNRKLKRLRMNQRLRRAIQPKNAIMILNEMKTRVHFTLPETQSSMSNSLFIAHAEIDGKTYVGQGLSKHLARQNAAENAVKCLFLEKMTAASMKAARLDAESDGTNQSMDASNLNDESTESTEKMETCIEEEDDISWSSLVCFAVYKLFHEWQNQGTVVPVLKPGVSPTKVKRDVKPTVEKELPANAISIHPVMLLNQMRPGLTYVEVNRVGNPPNTMFTLGVEIDGVEYTGTAKNKKDAKKITAKAALSALYGLTYPEEVKIDHAEDIQMS